MSPDQEETIRNALATDHHSQGAYTGQIQQTETVVVIDENGVPIQKELSFFISWDSIVALLKMISKRAGL